VRRSLRNQVGHVEGEVGPDERQEEEKVANPESGKGPIEEPILVDNRVERFSSRAPTGHIAVVLDAALSTRPVSGPASCGAVGG
jgi:hypothetical protein